MFNQFTFLNWIGRYFSTNATNFYQSSVGYPPLVGSASPRIVGGVDATESQAPFQCSLQMHSEHFCGCTIISSKWILTAAHCVGKRRVSIIPTFFFLICFNPLKKHSELTSLNSVFQQTCWKDSYSCRNESMEFRWWSLQSPKNDCQWKLWLATICQWYWIDSSARWNRVQRKGTTD